VPTATGAKAKNAFIGDLPPEPAERIQDLQWPIHFVIHGRARKAFAILHARIPRRAIVIVDGVQGRSIFASDRIVGNSLKGCEPHEREERYV
jgi:hypothetical protein